MFRKSLKNDAILISEKSPFTCIYTINCENQEDNPITFGPCVNYFILPLLEKCY